MKKEAQKLADLIEQNPSCKFDIDNDMWYMIVPSKKENAEEDNSDEIADSNKFAWSTDWYGHSSNYGAGIAEALIILLNRRGFDIHANAV